MARGNQRELARQKNMKKSQEISKGKRKEDRLIASQRKQTLRSCNKSRKQLMRRSPCRQEKNDD
ncbi:unnamed protein product [Pipistrellus nathusii]|uniref:Small EDRK-rich factor-like N-terminal domain-containing protein n=1 Tax=Pipistrellus nathusii TaxID=59473 RepID=A0ABP0AE96_PIPNA